MSAEFSVRTGGERPTVALVGDWTANNLGDAPARLAEAVTADGPVAVDIRKVRRLDTAGAYALVRALPQDFDLKAVQARPESARLLELVGAAVHVHPVAPARSGRFREFTIRLGKGVMNIGYEWVDTLAFLGHLLVVVARAFVYLFTNPKRIRWAAIFALAERAGLDAIPIVAITSFFIGAVVGLLGANMLSQFGAQVFAVELIGIAVLREFNIIITAVLLAGRSASSFAAELGSMKMNQEIDAMQVMGVDPFEALVLPRFVALLATIPLLTFVATLSGLFGGMVVVWLVLDLGPAFFLQRIVDNVGVVHFWVGMSKAPVMAAVIAGIGCRQGLEVGGDVESLGRRVTAAVVHAIFAIIMIDAAFALLFMKLNL
ncbi:MAG TPA: ABC transporter permease [Phenylobacterium sp.]|nr:ABC transporter permease [Phenylobacterium sp.]